ncbi:MAG: hypothetical protein ACYCU7_17040 [Acidimicrobiales bacterium]
MIVPDQVPKHYGDRHVAVAGLSLEIGDGAVVVFPQPDGPTSTAVAPRLLRWDKAQEAELQRTLRKTIVLVTHDIEEAAELGDRIAVLSPVGVLEQYDGVLEQYDTPAEAFGHPAAPFIAEFVGDDRGAQRPAVTAVTAVTADDRFDPPVVTPGTAADDERVAAYLGVPPPNRLDAAMRRPVGGNPVDA